MKKILAVIGVAVLLFGNDAAARTYEELAADATPAVDMYFYYQGESDCKIAYRILTYDEGTKTGTVEAMRHRYTQAYAKDSTLLSPKVYKGNIIFPETIEYAGATFTVTKVGYAAFFECAELKNVVIPKTVVELDSFAFDTSTIDSLTLNEGLKHIGVSAFGYSTYNGKDIVIPQSVDTIALQAFYQVVADDCFIHINSTIKKIGRRSFYQSTFKAVVFPERMADLEYIGRNAFSCGLKEDGVAGKYVTVEGNVVTGKKLKEIVEYAFYYAQKYENFSFKIESIEDKTVTRKIGQQVFAYSGIEEFYIEDGELSPQIFQASKLEKATIGGDIKFTKQEFYGCSYLTELNIAEDCNLKFFARGFLNNSKGITAFICPDGIERTDTFSFRNTTALAYFDFKNIQRIGRYAFEFSGIQRADLGNGLDTLLMGSFKDCYNLKSVCMPPARLIRDSVFYNTPNIESIVITEREGSSIPKIKEHFFANYNATLYVSAEKLDSFKTADVWKNFANIKTLEDAEHSVTLSDASFLLTINRETAYVGQLVKVYLSDTSDKNLNWITIKRGEDGTEERLNCSNDIYCSFFMGDEDIEIVDYVWEYKPKPVTPTEVSKVTVARTPTGIYYDLSGRAYVEKPQKPGIYIIDGKKILINNK